MRIQLQEKSPAFDILNGSKQTRLSLKERKFIFQRRFHRRRRRRRLRSIISRTRRLEQATRRKEHFLHKMSDTSAVFVFKSTDIDFLLSSWNIFSLTARSPTGYFVTTCHLTIKIVPQP